MLKQHVLLFLFVYAVATAAAEDAPRPILTMFHHNLCGDILKRASGKLIKSEV
jgi:hypothetical protein